MGWAAARGVDRLGDVRGLAIDRAELVPQIGVAHDHKGPALRVAARRGADRSVEDLRDQRLRNRIRFETADRPCRIDRLEQTDVGHCRFRGHAVGTSSRAAEDRSVSGKAAGRLASRSSWTPNWLSRANSPPLRGSHRRCIKRSDDVPRWTMPVSTSTGSPNRGTPEMLKASSKVEYPRRSASM